MGGGQCLIAQMFNHVVGVVLLMPLRIRGTVKWWKWGLLMSDGSYALLFVVFPMIMRVVFLMPVWICGTVGTGANVSWLTC